MEFLNRYRNITVLLLVIFAQLLLLAVQVKNDQDVYLIRVWTVTAVTPLARILEGFRGGSIGFVRNYILLHDADAENRRLTAEVNRLKIDNIFLRNELSSAERAKALQLFQAHTPSKMLAATVILTGAGSNSKVVFVDRGTADGVMRGMAVVTPEGIVGKVIAAYPTGSMVLLVTDPDFAAGVISQKGQVRGTFKGQGTPLGKVDYVPSEEKVADGEWFYTSGDDRVFPRGFPVGQARVVRPNRPFQEILVEPSGLQHGLEDVLIVITGVHQDIPDTPPVNQPVYIAPPPPAPTGAGAPADASGVPLAPGGTVADKLRQQYKALGDAEKHKFGEGEPGTLPPDFTRLGQIAPAAPANPAPSGGAAAPPGTSPATTQPPSPAKQPPETGKKPDQPATPAVRTPAPPTADPTAPAKRPPDPAKKPSGNPLADDSALAFPAPFIALARPPAGSGPVCE
jgi:rod shape-determining protein MreC